MVVEHLDSQALKVSQVHKDREEIPDLRDRVAHQEVLARRVQWDHQDREVHQVLLDHLVQMEGQVQQDLLDRKGQRVLPEVQDQPERKVQQAQLETKVSLDQLAIEELRVKSETLAALDLLDHRVLLVQLGLQATEVLQDLQVK